MNSLDLELGSTVRNNRDLGRQVRALPRRSTVVLS